MGRAISRCGCVLQLRTARRSSRNWPSRRGGSWIALLAHATPEFRVVSGLRRITNQQLDPLAGIGVRITPEILKKYKWEAFWDAPLNVPGAEPAHNDCTPPQSGVLNQHGLLCCP